MNKIPVEVLAPAGSFESMKAAVAAGADAVYIGGSRFGARAYADNPEEDRLLEAIDYAHLHGCRLYLTVNTLMKERELAELSGYLTPYYERGVDAVIVQDMGAFAHIRRHFPDLPIHASTQMTITGARGAAMAKAMGAARIVTARELSLEEIALIRQEVDIEVESFVHGALCYGYSGACLFSSLIGGRSGNRGRCAQPCRLPYEVRQGLGGRALNKKDEQYVLSLKDLCTLNLIPDIIEAGVFSLKIEGRMKSPRYTAGVVSVYRKYVDLYLESGREGYRVDEKDRRLLLDLFDRGGFTEGYYCRQNGREMTARREKPEFREGNQALFEYLDKRYVEAERQESVEGRLALAAGREAVLTLRTGDTEVTVSGGVPQEAVSLPLTEDKIRRQMSKTGNTPFVLERLVVDQSGDLFLPLQALNELRRNGLERLEGALLAPYRRKIGTGAAEAGAEAAAGGRKQPPALCLHVSLERPDTLKIAAESPEVRRIYIDSAEFRPKDWRKAAEICRRAKKECMLAMPYVFRLRAERFFDEHREEFLAAEFDGVLVRSAEEPGYLTVLCPGLPMVFDYSMYVMNREAAGAMYGMGAAELTYPVELNSRELAELDISAGLIVYGRLPMLVTAQCVLQGTKGCSKTPGILALRDRMGKEFPVKNHCAFCYNTIYNSAPLSLSGQRKAVEAIGPSSLRLQFTTESAAEAGEILRGFAEEFFGSGKARPPLGDFTRGHFKRGVM